MKQKLASESEKNRFNEEIEEFFKLYPDVDLDEVPKKVWQEVQRGVSLTQAYEKYAKESTERKREAEEVNTANREKSYGKVKNSNEQKFFTAKDIAAMSASDIRNNYDAIIKSMESKDFY